jgi:hypothetical protein
MNSPASSDEVELAVSAAQACAKTVTKYKSDRHDGNTHGGRNRT